jgi:hypothetical protein
MMTAAERTTTMMTGPDPSPGPQAGDPWADPQYRPEPAPPLPSGLADAMADRAYYRPPGTTVRLMAELMSPHADPEPEAGL